MTNRLLFQVLIGAILLTSNISKDTIPLGKFYFKMRVCELNIEELLKHKSIRQFNVELTKSEVIEIKKLTDSYCKPFKTTTD